MFFFFGGVLSQCGGFFPSVMIRNMEFKYRNQIKMVNIKGWGIVDI